MERKKKSINKSKKEQQVKNIKKSKSPKNIKKSKSPKKIKKSKSPKNMKKSKSPKNMKKRKSPKNMKKRKSPKKSTKNISIKQIGGNNIQQIPIGSMLKVVNNKEPEQGDELKLVKNDIVYSLYSPNEKWWMGVSSNAVKKALKAKGKETESVHLVTLETIQYLLKNPDKINKKMYGELLGWFPNQYVVLYTPKKNTFKDIIKSFYNNKEEIKTSEILKTVEMLPSPEKSIPPHINRKLENIPKRRQ